jgi:hypothetical protein
VRHNLELELRIISAMLGVVFAMLAVCFCHAGGSFLPCGELLRGVVSVLVAAQHLLGHWLVSVVLQAVAPRLVVQMPVSQQQPERDWAHLRAPLDVIGSSVILRAHTLW